MSIEIRNVSKSWGQTQALENVSLRVASGELVALLGPSGSGKTTLLRIMAGFEHADRGQVTLFDRDVTHEGVAERAVGFVFQHYALFRHMNVFENIAFGLRVLPRKRRPTDSEIRARVHELVSLVRLEGLASRYPNQLSGGQRQRVALARALAVRPRVLLLDEPFGALDAQVREELRTWLRKLHDELHVTSVFVTHDQEEALELADRVVVMNQGRIEQVGSPEALLDEPSSAFVHEFMGQVNVFEGTVRNGEVPIGPLRVPAWQHENGSPVRVMVRAYDVNLWEDPSGVARVERVMSSGSGLKVRTLVADSVTVVAQLPRGTRLQPGSRVGLGIAHARVYPADETPSSSAMSTPLPVGTTIVREARAQAPA